MRPIQHGDTIVVNNAHKPEPWQVCLYEQTLYSGTFWRSVAFFPTKAEAEGFATSLAFGSPGALYRRDED